MTRGQVVLYAIILFCVGALFYVGPRYYVLNKQHQQLQANYDSLGKIAIMEPHIDTVYKDTTIYLTTKLTVRDSIYIPDIQFVDVCRFLRTYRDTIEGDDVTLYYDMQTRGSLIGLDIWYDIHTPTTITHYIPIHTTIPCKIRPWAFYVNTGVVTNLRDMEMYMGGSAYYKRFGIHYNFFPGSTIHQIGVGVKLY
jgi:hypothetical protein